MTWTSSEAEGSTSELDVLVLDFYTFGGVGAEWGVTYDPVTMEDLGP